MASNNVQHCKSTAPAVEWRCISPSDVSQDSNSEVIMEVDLTGQVIDLTENSDTEGDDDDVLFVEEIRKSSSKVRALRDFRPSCITPEPVAVDVTLEPVAIDLTELMAFVSEALNCDDLDQFLSNLLPSDN